ncbi:MAG: NAD-dependent epimerase/dehydratase [Candidatus Magasanikbacteria bacterium GW2011_GWC2_40_17]|uniref:NAD-dependent epimerase/dehydratase n=1 Tax=Candidatus Magasanikbacteria bacterium GW2011_GWA2_42_32 TaxID=1619039 RepID=A0A0G1D669_9BACT|nr:MAG: NAD-dependent epimerase/dehydratase [Candidatus Magasanikbacteria bacterium GW2011_GWC2_40_17]KKS57558.1 MAG: NAD-dependent epimerase/dehydratase [Candidatus Magasanikbacteria bacterium GW2011_GWA2_42_32]OGH85434.1 MAG: epimerase [Candidatus Magasanikbacteria bacterium RIFOXYB2_FULL_38_10]
MHFLITGGSGFLGINLIRYLLNKSHRITSLDLVEFDYPEKDKIRAIIGDIRKRDDVIKSLEGADMVVHCAAALPLYTKEEIFSTDVEGTRIVLEESLKKGIKRVIHISSTAVYGIPDHHPLIENDKLQGVGPYGEAKILAEQVGEEFRKKDLCVPIIRPKSFIGPERLGVFALFYDWARTGHNFPMLGSGNNHYQLLDVEDLCEAIYLCITLPKEKVNDTFNIGAKQFTTMKEDYQVVLDSAGFGKKIIGLPATPAIWALRFLEKMHLSPLYKWVYETASKDSFVSIEKAEHILGYAPKFSNKNALMRNYKWYLANLKNFEGKSGISHRVPWKQGILALAKWVF